MRAALAGKTGVLVESMSLIAISLVGMTEGLRLVMYKEPNTLYDPLGPGYYALAVSTCLLAVGVAYLVSRLRNPVQTEVVPVDRRMKVRLACTVGACVIYVVLINLVGYLLASIIFFVIEFKIEGPKSWLSVVVLSLVVSGLYYIVFVKLCRMVFPAGVIFG
jgi:putative tricarboxylic transport membrane protein